MGAENSKQTAVFKLALCTGNGNIIESMINDAAKY